MVSKNRTPAAKPEYFIDEVMRLIRSGHTDKAMDACGKIVRSESHNPVLLHFCARIALRCSRLMVCIDWLQIALEKNDDLPDIHFELARAYGIAGRHEKAIRHFQRVIDRAPDQAEAYYGLGQAYSKTQRWPKALGCFQKTLSIDASHAGAHYAMAMVFLQQGDLIASRYHFSRTAELRADNWRAWGNLCLVLRELGDTEDARRCGKRAVALNPDAYAVWHNLANACRELERYEEAIECYQRALALHPDFADAHAGLGVAFLRSGDTDRSLEAFEAAIESDPTSALAAANLYSLRRNEAAWKTAARYGQILHESTVSALRNSSLPQEPPFLNLIRCEDPQINLEVARAWSRDIDRRMARMRETLRFEFSRSPDEIIRIGYLSNNFGNHPTAHITRRLYRLHDRRQFKIFCFSYGAPDSSYFRRSIEDGSDVFIDIRGMSHADAAKTINRHGIDILVDLVGFMKGERMAIAALRPAPIQVRWLGMAGTTGADFFDYQITDRIVTPPSEITFYTEKFVYMPNCYQINDNRPFSTTADTPIATCGLPEDAFVFCCFNSGYKIDAAVFQAWMNILKCCRGSVLWLMAEADRFKRNLRQHAVRHGIDPDRLIFAPKIAKHDHLTRLSRADLCLDTWCVNGAASTSDALWAGVPVVTRKGRHFASRMSASILNAIGLGALVAPNQGDYERVAVQLANDSLRLQRAKAELARNIRSAALFNTEVFVADLEVAYRSMHRRFRCGEAAAMIDVEKEGGREGRQTQGANP